jgi:hypothetical protein
MPDVRSNIRVETNDLDCTSSYPNGQIALNISRETTWRELSKVKGLEEEEWRKFGINLSGGHNNAMELCAVGFQYPAPHELLAGFRKELAQKNIM